MRIDKFVFKGYPKQDVPEKRFLISWENLDVLNLLRGYQVAQITDCQETEDIRTRKIEIEGKTHYFRIKEELEEPISKKIFEESCDNMYHLYRLVSRKRYAFADGMVSSAILSGVELDSGKDVGRGMFMMLDVFDHWNQFGILTVKGSKELGQESAFELPGTLKVIKEITDDKTYCTKSIATIDYTSFLE